MGSWWNSVAFTASGLPSSCCYKNIKFLCLLHRQLKISGIQRAYASNELYLIFTLYDRYWQYSKL